MRSRFRRLLVHSLALGFVVSLVPACDDDPTGIADDPDWVAALRGFQERPDPVTTDAQGTAYFVDEGTRIRYRIDVQEIDDVTLAHIHAGGPDVVGPIVVTLFDADGEPESFGERGVLAEGFLDGDDLEPGGGIASLAALVESMEAGELYVNVHTLAHGDGEIRGQIQIVFPPD